MRLRPFSILDFGSIEATEADGEALVERFRHSVWAVISAFTVAVFFAGCAASTANDTPSPADTRDAGPASMSTPATILGHTTGPPAVTSIETMGTPTSVDLPEFVPTPGYQFLVAGSDMAAEKTRFPFVVLDPNGAFVEDATISISFFTVDQETGDTGEPRDYRASFRSLETEEPHLHEDGSAHIHMESRGIYVVNDVDFDRPGIWGIRAVVSSTDDPTALINLQVALRVEDRTLTPAIGVPAPRSEQATARNVRSLADISTSESPLPALYELTVAEALDAGKPFLVAFSTPAFCQSRLCGPVLEEVIKVMPEYQGRVTFMHVEPYELETLRGGGGFTLVPAAVQWGLPSEPWIFVVGSSGLVEAKFEAIVTVPELRLALDAVASVQP